VTDGVSGGDSHVVPPLVCLEQGVSVSAASSIPSVVSVTTVCPDLEVNISNGEHWIIIIIFFIYVICYLSV